MGKIWHREAPVSLIYKEADFSPDYREAEVRQIMETVYRLRSIAVTGLAGMGKSNVVRFVVSHPEVRRRYLKERADDYAFVHVDCAALARHDEAELLGEIAMQLRSSGLAPDAPRLLDGSMRHALREQLLGVNPTLNLALVLDYFDQAAEKLDQTFFNYLFHLRNARGGKLSYVFVTRRPMGNLGELQELLDDPCVIGPLSHRDAVASVQRDEARLGRAFSQAERDRLIACTGGHPGFLKNGAELLGSGQLDASLPPEEIVRQLLRSDKVKSLCRELWDDLLLEEQPILYCVARDAPLPKSADGARVAYLEKSGVMVGKEGKQGWSNLAIFCPLFEAFVREIVSAGSDAVCVTAVLPNQARIETFIGTESVALSARLFALLAAFTEARGEALSTDDLVARVYGEKALDVADAALSQLVKRLRAALDPCVRRMMDDSTYTCVETIRGVGSRFTS
jgi:DNA-binding winged helix-turn-helix (wHTH) protein